MIRLALSVGRTDWTNLLKEHTPYELSVLRAYEIIEPFGERRADMRMAMQTLSLMQVQCTKQFSAEQRESILSGLMGYAEGPDDKQVTPEEAAKQCKAAFAAIGK